MVDFLSVRRAMVDGQIRTSDVTHPGLIAATLDIPREAFVPEGFGTLAYLDRDVPLGDAAAGAPARYLIKPVVLARLIQAADPDPQDHALVVGAGSGYSAAVLARLVASVVALEQDEGLLARARSRLPAFGGGKVTIVDGPLVRGAPSLGPYNVILIDGGVETLPDGLCEQLSSQGRLVTVVCSGPIGKATLFRQAHGDLSGRILFDASAPVLPGFIRAPEFVF